MMTTTAQATAYWQDRHPGVERLKWLQAYWDSWQAPHRRAVLQGWHLASSYQPPIDSIAEVGCHAGPNLRLLRQNWRMPYAPALYGLDVNREALDFGRAQAEAAGWGHEIQWIEGSALEVEAKLPVVDFLFTCYTLAYLDPSDLVHALGQIGARARRAALFLEPSTMWDLPAGQCGPGPEWRHDYQARLWCLNRPIERVTIWHVRPERDRLDTAILVEFSPPAPLTGDPRHG